MKRKAAENMAAVRDNSLEKFLCQLTADVVPPQTVLNAARDMHVELEKMREREATLASSSVVDEWLEHVYADDE